MKIKMSEEELFLLEEFIEVNKLKIEMTNLFQKCTAFFGHIKIVH